MEFTGLSRSKTTSMIRLTQAILAVITEQQNQYSNAGWDD
jgi:hypothetical protein